MKEIFLLYSMIHVCNMSYRVYCVTFLYFSPFLSFILLTCACSSVMGKMQMAEDFNFSVGQRVTGYVYKVDKEWVWLAVSWLVKAKLFILDSACEPSDLENFQQRVKLGTALSGYILSVNRERKSLRLIMHPFSAISNGLENSYTSDEKEVAMFIMVMFLVVECGRLFQVLVAFLCR